MKSYNATIQMKATEQYFPVVPLITLYKVVLTFESVGEILKCDHSNETSLAILSHSTICFSPLYKIKLCGIITLATFAPHYYHHFFGLHRHTATCTGIHIRSHPVVPDNYNLAWTIKITPKVVLWTTEVLLNHKIFSKILI